MCSYLDLYQADDAPTGGTGVPAAGEESWATKASKLPPKLVKKLRKDYAKRAKRRAETATK